MSDNIRRLKEQYGSESPAAAAQLNSLGVVLQRHGDIRTALQYHQEALAILEWNRCNALLYDFAEKSKEYAVDMAITLRNIGNILREKNNFVGAAGTSPKSWHELSMLHLLHALINCSSLRLHIQKFTRNAWTSS